MEAVTFLCARCGRSFKPVCAKKNRTPRYCSGECYRKREWMRPELRMEHRRDYMRRYMRRRRHNGEEIARPKQEDGAGHVTQAGYHTIFLPEHPLAGKNGTVFSHRQRLYDEIGPGSHPCFWCEATVTWDIRLGPGRLVVDHVDGNGLNNALGNLVPSCDGCNGAPRGMKLRLLAFLRL